MNDSTRVIFEQLGVSLAIGLLVGLQRQRSESLIAGVRTFPLITVFGTLAAIIDGSRADGNGWIVPLGLLALISIVSVSYVVRAQQDRSEHGITTEIAILLMYLLGAYIVTEQRVVAIAIGAGIAVLLQFKPELHGIASRLSDDDARAIMTFALITFIILPVVPNKTYDVAAPLNVLNPYQLWWMVVLMVGISLGGYLVYKFFGKNAGVLAGGLLGGLISSTATTISYARRSRENSKSDPLCAAVIILASTVVYARVLLEMSVVAPTHFAELYPPIAIMMGASALAAAAMFVRVRGQGQEMPEQKKPDRVEIGSGLRWTLRGSSYGIIGRQ